MRDSTKLKIVVHIIKQVYNSNVALRLGSHVRVSLLAELSEWTVTTVIDRTRPNDLIRFTVSSYDKNTTLCPPT